jgi:HD superfamily phosphohydrolase
MARRLMYWQVYLHKTAIAAEKMLINVLRRAQELESGRVAARHDPTMFASPAVQYFLPNKVGKQTFLNDPHALENFANLDDNDIWSALKVWSQHDDKVLSLLSLGLLNRRLFKIEVELQPFSPEYIAEKRQQLAKKHNLSPEEINYFVVSDEITSNMYSEADDSIDILYKNGTIKNIAEASDMLNIQLLSKKIKKYYLCFLRS